MPMISFSGKTAAGPFWEQIRMGRKTQTIREPRKDNRPHARVGDICQLYWKVRTKITDKPVHRIATVKITAYEPITLLDMWDDEENAMADGFASLEEFRLYFLEEWCLPFIKEMIEAMTALRKQGVDSKIFTARRTGKTTAYLAFKRLTAPMYRIKWVKWERAE